MLIQKKSPSSAPVSRNFLLKAIIIGASLAAFILVCYLVYSNLYLNEKIANINSELATKKEKAKPQITIPSILYNLSGIIQDLGKNAIVLKASVSQLDENGNPSQRIEVRKVLVNSATQISKLAFVTQKDTNKRVPQETPLSFGDLKVGDPIEVISSQDVSSKEEFEAVKVRMLPKGF